MQRRTRRSEIANDPADANPPNAAPVPMPARKRRNMPAPERAHEILLAAMELFAERGFGASLQELAARVGVTQPLLHRYYPTKADLVRRCKEELMNGHWQGRWSALVSDTRLPLRERMEAYYADYLPRIYRYVWYRTFLFAAIEDPAFARDYLNQVTERILVVVMREVRQLNGLPAPEKVPFHEREYELIWGMHSTFAFQGMRVLIYGFPAPSDMRAFVADQVRGYLEGAKLLLPEIVAAPASKPERRSRR